MANLTNPKMIWFKGVLFLALGCVASVWLVARMSSLGSVALLVISVWAFCRAYYFAFYVIEHYVDPHYRFAGLIDFMRYAWLGRDADRME